MVVCVVDQRLFIVFCDVATKNPSVGDNEDDDDNNNDVWLESATKQLSVLSKLPDICASDIRESREITRQKVNEEIVRQKLLRTSRETCLPCNGE